MRWLILAFTFATFAGCSLADALENAPCDSDDDCIGDYTCVKTLHEEANAESGLCRSDGKCVAGEQEGCVTAGGSCTSYLLTVVTDEATGVSYCCDTGGANDASVTQADGSSARCIACPSDLCSGSEASEPCSEGEARCVVAPESTCGCRVPANEIENSECDDASTCGEGFVCTRTLEQEAEPDELQPEDRLVEDGQCRPEDAPECVTGVQEGCRAESGCPGSGLDYQCAGTRCYCCDSPANSNEYSVHVYADTELGESAACVECPKSDCMTSTCTALEDPTCELTGGTVCGCLPAA